MQIIKEELRNIKPSILRYHMELRRGLGEGWIQSLRTRTRGPASFRRRLEGADFVTKRTVKQIKEQNRHCRGYKYYVPVIKTSVFKLTSRMQAVITMLVSACILMDIMDLIPSIKFLAHKAGRRLSLLEGWREMDVPPEKQVPLSGNT